MGCVYRLLYLLVVWRGVACAGVGLGRLSGLCVRVIHGGGRLADCRLGVSRVLL